MIRDSILVQNDSRYLVVGFLTAIPAFHFGMAVKSQIFDIISTHA